MSRAFTIISARIRKHISIYMHIRGYCHCFGRAAIVALFRRGTLAATRRDLVRVIGMAHTSSDYYSKVVGDIGRLAAGLYIYQIALTKWKKSPCVRVTIKKKWSNACR